MDWLKSTHGNFLGVAYRYYNNTKRYREFSLKEQPVNLNLEQIAKAQFYVFTLDQYTLALPQAAFHVGLRNEKDVSFIGKQKVIKQSARMYERRFYFKDNKPQGYHYAGVGEKKGSIWPKNRSALLDEEDLAYFNDLKSHLPEASNNIDICVQQLLVHGEDYIGN